MSKRDLIVAGIIGILLIFNLLSYYKISHLEERMQVFDFMQNEIQNVNGAIQGISVQLDEKLNEFMQEQLWIQDKKYNIANANVEENKIDVIMDWSLRDIRKGEKVDILYREKGDKNWTELDAARHDGLNYTVEHTFPLKGNYETQVIATSDDGQRAENLLDLNFKEQLNQRIQTNAFVHQVGNGQFDVNIDIQNSFKTEFLLSEDRENLKIKSAKAELFINGEVFKEWDLIKENQHFESDSYSEILSYYDLINLKEEVGEKIGEVELRVMVVDGLGLRYETVGTSEGKY